MDWLKCFKPAGDAKKRRATSGGDFVSWRLRYKNIRIDDYVPDILLDVFNNGFVSDVKEINARPYEFRLTFVAARIAHGATITPIGFNQATGIYIDKKTYESIPLDGTNCWNSLSKEDLRRAIEICDSQI